MSLYKVEAGKNPRISDVNQIVEALLGEASVGTLSLAGVIAPPSAAPTLTATAGAGLGVGTYQYAYTLVVGVEKSDGELLVAGETTASPTASVTTTAANSRVTFVTPTAGLAQTVIGKRIYRSVVGGATLKLVATIPTNQASFVDAVADEMLGVAPPSVNDTATKLRLGRDPVDPDEAVTKQYADTTFLEKTQLGTEILQAFNTASTASGEYADWNHVENTKPGVGRYLLLGSDLNGPGPSGVYFHTLNVTYGGVDGTKNLTQIAVPYGATTLATNGIYIRGRYQGTWTAWQKMWHSGNDGAGSGLDADLLDNMQPTSAATASTVMSRDAAGRAKVAAPSAADDIARKDTVDALKTTANTWTQRQTFQGGVIDGNADTDVSRVQALQHQTHKRSTMLTYTSGQLTTVEEKSGATVVKATTLNYTDGRLSSVVETADGVTITTTLNYDANGVLTSTTRA